MMSRVQIDGIVHDLAANNVAVRLIEYPTLENRFGRYELSFDNGEHINVSGEELSELERGPITEFTVKSWIKILKARRIKSAGLFIMPKRTRQF